ncbi:hypothetical protein GCM10022243_22420 [Saccharothrix violaceirubra]|uniref:Uncharacterized protein n=1 Tax=Saccharothrix violaceirubra TaxID=413306 RepID=A0A7W7T1G0_9PSEU|nr:hypothetical protein [Saccharothrix violaceirubra]MBB4964822.1 hypothetical protein [Saccharothrix violaceirubra]
MLEFGEDNDVGYDWWVAANPNQFVIDAEPSFDITTMVLHRVVCRTGIARDHVRICGTRRELETRYPRVRACADCMAGRW